MRATLLFDLDDLEDRKTHMRCVKSLDMALALWTFSGKLRTIVDESEDGKWIDEDLVWKAWDASLEEYDINLSNIID